MLWLKETESNEEPRAGVEQVSIYIARSGHVSRAMDTYVKQAALLADPLTPNPTVAIIAVPTGLRFYPADGRLLLLAFNLTLLLSWEMVVILAGAGGL